jgi:hypothetical protein
MTGPNQLSASDEEEVYSLMQSYEQGQRDAHSEFLTPGALAACGPEDPRYAKGQRDALAAAVQRVEALAILLVNVRLDFYDPDDYQQAVLLSEVIAAITGGADV